MGVRVSYQFKQIEGTVRGGAHQSAVKDMGVTQQFIEQSGVTGRRSRARPSQSCS